MSALQSLLDELKAESQRATMFHRRGVPFSRIKSLIRKYETQVPGDISDQPGEWQIRGGKVDAIQHEGTPASASHIRGWISERGGNSEWMGTYDQEVDHLRIRLDSPRSPNIVGPGWWVIKTADGLFFTMPDSDFHIVYVPSTEVE